MAQADCLENGQFLALAADAAAQTPVRLYRPAARDRLATFTGNAAPLLGTIAPQAGSSGNVEFTVSNEDGQPITFTASSDVEDVRVRIEVGSTTNLRWDATNFTGTALITVVGDDLGDAPIR